jgi:uncharacterized Zn finger protein
VSDSIPSDPDDTGPEPVRQYLQGLTREELIALVERLATQGAGVRRTLARQAERAHGRDAELLRVARATIDEVSAEAIYAGRTPDDEELAQLHDDLATLVERGQADDVLLLCQRLLGRANRAVEAMDETDDYFLAGIARVLELVPEALTRSSKSPVEQILWLHELELSEDYELLPSMHDFWSRDWPPAVWNEVAGRIEQRLVPGRVPPPGSLARDLKRDAWTRLLVTALEQAGRQDEVVPLLEREAEITASYQRLVTHLLEIGDLERAEHWARRGIETVGGQWPGSASQLRETLQTIRERQGDRAGLAALRAYAFFERPGTQAFQALLSAADELGQRDTVRQHALRFLETLRLPWQTQDAPSPSADRSTDQSAAGTPTALAALPPWPLPPTGLSDPPLTQHGPPPLARVLLDIALTEGRLDDVLAWYDVIRQRGRSGLYYGDVRPTVARAVEASHPDRAIGIWEELAAEAIARTSTGAYEEAARYLERSGQIEERRGNRAAWRQRVSALRERERRKWRLREILDGLLKRYPPA